MRFSPANITFHQCSRSLPLYLNKIIRFSTNKLINYRLANMIHADRKALSANGEIYAQLRRAQTRTAIVFACVKATCSSLCLCVCTCVRTVFATLCFMQTTNVRARLWKNTFALTVAWYRYDHIWKRVFRHRSIWPTVYACNKHKTKCLKHWTHYVYIEHNVLLQIYCILGENAKNHHNKRE